MRKALEQHNYKTAAVATICSVLNALSFDTVRNEDCGRHVVSQSALCQIVDFGDVAHICSVVDQIGDKRLQHACDVGRSIIQRALVSSLSDPSKQQRVDLVTALGLLANESKKLKESEGHVEAVTVLALVVTAALCCNQDGTLSILDMDSVPGPFSMSLLASKSGTISTTPSGAGASTRFDDDSIRGVDQVEERLSLQGQYESKPQHCNRMRPEENDEMGARKMVPGTIDRAGRLEMQNARAKADENDNNNRDIMVLELKGMMMDLKDKMLQLSDRIDGMEHGEAQDRKKRKRLNMN